MTKSKKKTVSTIGFMIVFSIIVIALYYLINTRTSPLFKDSASSMSEVEKLLNKDISNSYPASPREVLKRYSRIAQNYYNENLSDEQIEALSNQMLYLLDEELITNKTKEDYLIDLKVEITSFKKAGRTLMTYGVEDSESVVYWENDKKEFASLVVSFTLKEGSDYIKLLEDFILRKDEEGRWKILGWELSDKTKINTED